MPFEQDVEEMVEFDGVRDTARMEVVTTNIVVEALPEISKKLAGELLVNLVEVLEGL